MLIAVAEVFSVFTFENPFGGEPWAISKDHMPGDLGFDPLGLKPTNTVELKEMQTKELNNGRLAMIAVAGMVGQEPRRARSCERTDPRLTESSARSSALVRPGFGLKRVAFS